MAPLPKKKHAKSRSRRRRSTISLRLPSFVACPSCGELRLPHRVCPKCGFYFKAKKKYSNEKEK